MVDLGPLSEMKEGQDPFGFEIIPGVSPGTISQARRPCSTDLIKG